MRESHDSDSLMLLFLLPRDEEIGGLSQLATVAKRFACGKYILHSCAVKIRASYLIVLLVDG